MAVNQLVGKVLVLIMADADIDVLLPDHGSRLTALYLFLSANYEASRARLVLLDSLLVLHVLVEHILGKRLRLIQIEWVGLHVRTSSLLDLLDVLVILNILRSSCTVNAAIVVDG